MSYILQRQKNDQDPGLLIKSRRDVWLLRKPFVSPTFPLPSRKKSIVVVGEGEEQVRVSKPGSVSFCMSGSRRLWNLSYLPSFHEVLGQ